MDGMKISEFRSQNSEFRRRGFTLVEILVVIAIIIILVAMVVTIGTSVRISAHIKQTKATLRSLESANAAYKLDFGTDVIVSPTAVTDTAPTQYTDFAGMLMQDPAAKRGLLGLPPSVLQTGTTTSVIDGFGNPIWFETAYGSMPARFRSRGPDGVSVSTTPSTMADDILSNEP